MRALLEGAHHARRASPVKAAGAFETGRLAWNNIGKLPKPRAYRRVKN
jgi:hypothetical protein